MTRQTINTRKAIRVQFRMTIAEHNELMRDAINDGCTLSDVIRKRANLRLSDNKETSSAGVQLVSG